MTERTSEKLISKEPIPACSDREYTIEDYFEMEKYFDLKYEYYKGDVIAMCMPNSQHQAIMSNIHFAIKRRLKGKNCEAFINQRIYIPENSLITYPDLFITCGKISSKDNDGWDIINPTIIIEIQSLSTMDYDRGMKFALYRDVPTLKEYILIDSQKIHAEVFRLESNGKWVEEEFQSIHDMLKIKAINISFQLKEVYAWLKIEENELEFE